MELKRLLCLVLLSMFVISQSVIAINIENSLDNDNSINVTHYTQYPRAVKPSDPVTIPDAQLKAAINKNLDVSRKEDQDVTKAEMESLTELKSDLKGVKKYIISDLSGLEYAVNITSLSIKGNDQNKLELKNMDIVQKLTKLTILEIINYNINQIDISKNVDLQELDVSNNKLSTIDISKNDELIYLDIANNNLSTIDVSNNINLKYLYLEDNNLSTIDVKKNTNLIDLSLLNNNLSTIDVSNNTNLEVFYASENNLSAIDVSNNTELRFLYLSNNNLSTIDVRKNINLINFEATNQIINVNLYNITLQNDKVIIKNKVEFNGNQVGSIPVTGIIYDANINTVTIDNPNKYKSVSYKFDNKSGFSGTVTANLSATGVSLSSTNSIIKLGQTQQLTAIVTPNIAIDKSVTWISSDEKVATVDQNGLVKAVGVGTATITAKTNDGGFISSSNITVNSINQDFINNFENNQNNNQLSSNSIGITTNPQTGVAGLSGVLGMSGLGLCLAFASRKRKNK